MNEKREYKDLGVTIKGELTLFYKNGAHKELAALAINEAQDKTFMLNLVVSKSKHIAGINLVLNNNDLIICADDKEGNTNVIFHKPLKEL